MTLNILMPWNPHILLLTSYSSSIVLAAHFVRFMSFGDIMINNFSLAWYFYQVFNQNPDLCIHCQ